MNPSSRRSWWLGRPIRSGPLLALALCCGLVACTNESSDDDASGGDAPVSTSAADAHADTTQAPVDVATSQTTALPSTSTATSETTASTVASSAPSADAICSGYDLRAAVALVGGGAGASLEDMARAVMRALAPEIGVATISAGAPNCSVVATTSVGDLLISGAHSDEDGRWYPQRIYPVAAGDAITLSVRWIQGTVRVGSELPCSGCVTAEVTAIASTGRWVEQSSLPVEVTIEAPGSDTNRGLLIRYFDADGQLLTLQFVAIREGDFAAG
jgi:hypothetical protein